MLYYIKHEIIGEYVQQIQDGIPIRYRIVLSILLVSLFLLLFHQIIKILPFLLLLKLFDKLTNTSSSLAYGLPSLVRLLKLSNQKIHMHRTQKLQIIFETKQNFLSHFIRLFLLKLDRGQFEGRFQPCSRSQSGVQHLHV